MNAQKSQVTDNHKNDMLQRSSKPILMIRHAQSIQNLRKKQIVAALSEQEKQMLEQLPHYLQMKYSPTLMDAQLSENGIKQAMKTKQKLKDIKVDVVVVSPLKRALQTCDIIFGDRDTAGIKFYVQPLLAESLCAACDVGSQIKQCITKYKSKYNFDRYNEDKWSTWYIDNIRNQQIKQKIKHFQNGQQKQNIHQFVLSLMRHHKELQSQLQVRQRIKQLKNHLRKYQQQSKTKMAIVSHYHLLKHLSCKQYDNDGRPLDGIQLWNAQAAQREY